MSNLLEIQHLNKAYPRFSLKDVSFCVPKGYIMGFIGPNGAGKTTTIKSVLDMVARDAGDIQICGMQDTEERTIINEQIGVVMDAPFYVDVWTVQDVEAAVSPFYTRWNHDIFEDYLNRFEIDPKKKVKELSRGMKVKLMLAVALSHDAKLLILDEPTSGLDPVARDELCDILSEFVSDENRSVLFSTHITSDLEKIADFITFIQDGRILFSGLKEDLLEKYVLVKGGLDEITVEHESLLIGLRKHGTGFEGMAALENLAKLPSSVLTESISLEEIVVYMNKEAKHA